MSKKSWDQKLAREFRDNFQVSYCRALDFIRANGPAAVAAANAAHPNDRELWSATRDAWLEEAFEKSGAAPARKTVPPELAEPDWSRKCESCGESPVLPLTGMCGPCTWGEAETAGGNW